MRQPKRRNRCRRVRLLNREDVPQNAKGKEGNAIEEKKDIVDSVFFLEFRKMVSGIVDFKSEERPCQEEERIGLIGREEIPLR